MISPPVPSTFGRLPIAVLSAVCSARHVDARAREQRRGAAVLLREQRGKQVLRLDEPVVVAEREALRVGQRLLELGRQLVEAHVVFPVGGAS